ncbi:CCR4-NOT regulatory complex component [Maudiozyma exigua]|uniref:CCR4-NOT regulatory complex component n=1 Tax=Maudiozyma exigua TaxID=34358 RepID=A0A9P7B8G8_MAUEX|nr:CCR4-NOT regulatory complex component [Kazachstania exigua]
MTVISYAVEIEDLTYTFPGKKEAALKDVTMQIPWNTRTLVIGSNGAGKSTLLKLLSGKHLCLNGKIQVNGLDPFSPLSMHLPNNDEADGDVQVSTYLGTEWCHMNIINRDIGVLELLESIGLKHFQKRGDLLCDILEIDLEWRMHQLSDGQKRRVQLVMGLLKPWRVLLLDEVTVDLDVIARSRLLDFLKMETETRKCSVVYATHIFDGLAQWPDNIYHIKDGRLLDKLDYKKDVEFTISNEKYTNGDVTFNKGSHISISKVNSLHPLALAWLKRDNNINE